MQSEDFIYDQLSIRDAGYKFKISAMLNTYLINPQLSVRDTSK